MPIGVLRGNEDPGWCGAAYPAEAQHYAYTVVAMHLLAVCYYAQNYGDEDPVFASWQRFVGPQGYCTDLAVPTVAEVMQWREKKKKS